MLKSPYKYIMVYDFETGGLHSQINAITELAIAIIDADTLEIVEKDSWLVKPYDSVYEELALEKTNLTLEKLENEGVELSEVFEEFMDYIEEYTEERRRPTIAGHNIDSFDVDFMKVLLTTHNQRWDRTFNKNTTIDTLKLCRLIYPTFENYKLETMCKAVGVELKNAHRAADDTLANALLLINILKKLRK